MGKDSSVNMPGGFGGLMRYNEEYDSKLKLKPGHVIIFVLLVIIFVLGLNIFFPVKVV